MRSALSLAGVCLAVGVVAAASQPATTTQSPSQVTPAPVAVAPPATTVANIAMPTLTAEEQRLLASRFSPERLAVMRARMQGDAQRAVHDEAEHAFRAPTALEAAALAGAPSDSSSPIVSVPSGGFARKADASSLEFVKATVDSKGVAVSTDGKGVRRDQ